MRMSECSDESFNICTKVQMSGILFKKSFAHHSTKWSKRFFIVKEGFLLYYSENEKRAFDKKGYFNIHPKGVIPLGGCIVEQICDINQEYSIRIRSDDFINGNVLLAATTRYDQDRWTQILLEAARITWENTVMSEAIIRDLESQGLQLNQEKQSYVEKLHEETIALRDEIDKNEELERINAALDEEKKRLEKLIDDIRLEHEQMKEEYEETLKAVNMVEQDKVALEKTTDNLLKNLSELEEEKLKILGNLKKTETKNVRLSQTSETLEAKLKDIEDETRFLLEEKQEIEQRYKENELRARVLSEEKELITQQSNQLLSSLNDLLAQKGLAETDLRLEVEARLEAEERLQLAQNSVNNLEGVLQQESDSEMSSIREKILPDVKKLRKFFEQVAEEARIDANMPVIMKNSVYAKKAMAKKARSQQLEQSRQEKAKSLGFDLNDANRDGAPLKRSLSIMITKKSLKPKNLSRSKSLRMANGALLSSWARNSNGQVATGSDETSMASVPEEDK